MPGPSNGLNVLILGGGIAGLTTALALTKFAPKDQIPNIKIFEIRPEPATIGGAVNLTPNALRMLDHLGALQIIRDRDYGKTIDFLEIFDIYSTKLAESSFRGSSGHGIGNPPYKALRITRGDALKAVLSAIEACPNITLTCGKRTTRIDESPSSVTLHFSDSTSATGDLLMGCDGIHSITRLSHVEPDRKATYSGVSNAFGFTPIDPEKSPVHFDCTAINFARRGMLLTSYHNSAKDSVYVGALMQVADVGSRDGWKVAGSDAEKIRAEILDRFTGGADGECKIECLRPLIERAQDFFLWPVFTLSKGGKWCTERVMLLGDAAHAMPPQGESTGIVFEDTVLFSRCLTRWMDKRRDNASLPMKEAFDAYEKLRRGRIEVAFEESKNVVSTVSDAGWFGHKVKTFIVPWYLWFTRSYREKHFLEDVTTVDIAY